MRSLITYGIAALIFASMFTERSRCAHCDKECFALGRRLLNRQIHRHERLHRTMSEILEVLRPGPLAVAEIRDGVSDSKLSGLALAYLQDGGLVRQDWVSQPGFKPALVVYRRVDMKAEVAR